MSFCEGGPVGFNVLRPDRNRPFSLAEIRTTFPTQNKEETKKESSDPTCRAVIDFRFFGNLGSSGIDSLLARIAPTPSGPSVPDE